MKRHALIFTRIILLKCAPLTPSRSGACAVAVAGYGADPNLCVCILLDRPALIVLVDQAAPLATLGSPFPVRGPRTFCRLCALLPAAVGACGHRLNARQAVALDHTVVRVECIVVRAIAIIVEEAIDGGLIDTDTLLVNTGKARVAAFGPFCDTDQVLELPQGGR